MRTFVAFAALLLSACGARATPDIAISNGWARATVAGQTDAAAYLTISNRGGGEDRLVDVSIPRAGMAMLHGSTMNAGVMRMRALSDGLRIPAHTKVALAPNGAHIMLSGLTAPLRPGEQFPATLRFAKSGTRQATIKVEQASAR